jgi:hypothetical protein
MLRNDSHVPVHTVLNPEDTESSTGLGGLWYRRGLCLMGRDSSVGIAIRYGLDGPGIESRGGLYFPHPSRLDLGPTRPPIQWIPGLTQV